MTHQNRTQPRGGGGDWSLMAKAQASAGRWVISRRRNHLVSGAARDSQSMDAKHNNNVYKELGLFSLKKKIEDVVHRAEMIAPTALELEEARRIKQEEILREYNLWDDVSRSSESLTALADAVRVVNDLKDLKYKAEEAKLITELADMDVINDQLFKQAYEASLDVGKFLDRYEVSKLLTGPFDKEGACLIIKAGQESTSSQIWTEKLLNMYIKWSQKNNFEARVSEKYPSKGGGILSATIEFEKEFVYGLLSGEKGTHKMIRSSLDGSIVRETCSSGVDVIPLFLEPVELHIDDENMELSLQSSPSNDESGCRTKPVVSIHHIPSGVTVQCSGERSHFANKMKAINRLKAKLLLLAKEQGVSEENTIKNKCAESDWNDEVRRYMLRPRRMVQDVTTGLQLPDLNSVLDGNIEALIRAHIALRQGREET